MSLVQDDDEFKPVTIPPWAQDSEMFLKEILKRTKQPTLLNNDSTWQQKVQELRTLSDAGDTPVALEARKFIKQSDLDACNDTHSNCLVNAMLNSLDEFAGEAVIAGTSAAAAVTTTPIPLLQLGFAFLSARSASRAGNAITRGHQQRLDNCDAARGQCIDDHSFERP